MPNFVPTALKRYNFDRSQRKVHSPWIYVQPQYGAHQQLVETDDSDPLSSNDVILLQSIIATFLRVLDFTGLVALAQLAQAVANPTASTMEAAQDLLRYFTNHPSASVT